MRALNYLWIGWPIFILVLAVVALSGCATVPIGKTVTTTPVCAALIGPIKYNSQNLKSRRHAGPDLAPDLKRRNQVGQGLNCPEYR